MIAHRGASAYAPENTLAAFELALEQGVDMLEVDVRLTADDQPIIIHDETLERTTTGSGRVRDRSLRELKRLDAGSWRGPAFRGQRLQALQEVLERFRGRVGFAVELKTDRSGSPGVEERVVSLLEVYGVVDSSLILSFDRRTLETVGALNASLGRVALVGEGNAPLPDNVTAVVPAGTTAVGLQASLASEGHIRAARQAGLAVYIFTVNDIASMDRFIDWRVAGVFTDSPDVLRSRPRLRETAGPPPSEPDAGSPQATC